MRILILLAFLIISIPLPALADPSLEVWLCPRKQADAPSEPCDKGTDPAELTTGQTAVAVDVWAQAEFDSPVYYDGCRLDGRVWFDPTFFSVSGCNPIAASSFVCDTTYGAMPGPPAGWPYQTMRVEWTASDSGGEEGDLFQSASPHLLGSILLVYNRAPELSQYAVAHEDPPGIPTSGSEWLKEPEGCFQVVDTEYSRTNARFKPKSACGLGFELAPLLALLMRRRL